MKIMPDTALISRRALLAALATGLGTPAYAARPAGRPGTARATLPLVMLDPGHGGKDPGAIGVSGTYEKHIALAAALELKRQLEAAGHCRVGVTRTRDVFIRLPERVAIAQRRGAALFVSLHADALTDSDARGASVYTLGAPTDSQSAALAVRENSADRFAPDIRNQPPDVAEILSSLVRREARQGSARMARSVVEQLRPGIGLLPHPARHANFAVLKAADVPSVLVEMGFMSNQLDERALRTAEHRSRMAAALRRAIEAHLAAGNHSVRVTAG